MCGDYPQPGQLVSRASGLTSGVVNKARVASGIIVALVGTVWALQGLNVSFVPHSAMTGKLTWVIVGGLAVLFGIWLVWSARRRGDSPGPDDNAV